MPITKVNVPTGDCRKCPFFRKAPMEVGISFDTCSHPLGQNILICPVDSCRYDFSPRLASSKKCPLLDNPVLYSGGNHSYKEIVAERTANYKQMFKEIHGDMFTQANANVPDAICITTNNVVKQNGELVMGKGVALQAKQLWPWLPKRAANAISSNGHCVQLIGET